MLWKDEPAENAVQHLAEVSKLLESASDTPESDAVKHVLWGYAEEQGKGSVLWPLRVALSGAKKSPDPFVLVAILGKAEACARIAHALEKLHAV